MSGRAIGWLAYRFTGFENLPVYVDLLHVAAITAALETGDGVLAGMVTGSRVILYSGLALYVKESPDVVFEEVHRARTMPAPEPDKIRVGDIGPSAEPAPAVMLP